MRDGSNHIGARTAPLRLDPEKTAMGWVNSNRRQRVISTSALTWWMSVPVGTDAYPHTDAHPYPGSRCVDCPATAPAPSALLGGWRGVSATPLAAVATASTSAEVDRISATSIRIAATIRLDPVSPSHHARPRE